MSVNKLVLILIILGISVYFFMFYNSKQKVYFFLNKNDDNSFNELIKILKNPNYDVTVVNYDSDEESILKLNSVIKSCRPVDRILNIENMTDLTQIYFDTCYRNAKCVNQPSNKFYEIYNKLGVFGYPFKFENNSSELLGNNLIDVSKNATCNKPSGLVGLRRRRSSNY